MDVHILGGSEMKCSDFGLVQHKFVMFLVIHFWVVQPLCLSFPGSDGAVLRCVPSRGRLRTPSQGH